MPSTHPLSLLTPNPLLSIHELIPLPLLHPSLLSPYSHYSISLPHSFHSLPHSLSLLHVLILFLPYTRSFLFVPSSFLVPLYSPLSSLSSHSLISPLPPSYPDPLRSFSLLPSSSLHSPPDAVLLLLKIQHLHVPFHCPLSLRPRQQVTLASRLRAGGQGCNLLLAQGVVVQAVKEEGKVKEGAQGGETFLLLLICESWGGRGIYVKLYTLSFQAVTFSCFSFLTKLRMIRP